MTNTRLVAMLQIKKLALLLAVVMPVMANATTWYMKPVASGAGDCSTWADACASLNTAVSKIASNADQIWVSKGLYKFSTQVYNNQTSFYAIRIYGGLAGTETDVKYREPLKNVVVFSADTHNDDTSKTAAGVTPSYSNVGANATNRLLAFFNTGVSALSPVNVLDGVTVSGMNLKGIWSGGVMVYNAKAIINDVKFIGNKGHAAGIQVSQPFSNATITKTEFINNYAIDDAAGDVDIKDGGALYVESLGAKATCDICTFTGNKANGAGGAVQVTTGAQLYLTRSGFTSNSSETGAGGALNTSSTGIVDIRSTLFDSNTATASNGGAIAIVDGIANIYSTTFFANNAGNGSGKFGGAVNLGGGTVNTMVDIRYSTFVNNQATGASGKGGAININAAYLGAKLNLSTSFFANNNSTKGANISDMANVNDAGFNVVGYNNVSGAVTGASVYNFTGTSKTLAEPDITKITETTLKDNGGYFKSLKPTVGSVLINAIPNDTPASSIGTTPSNPFASIAQARAVMESYSSYDAGKYFFNINGTTFATYVDKQGYVLVASSDAANLQAANYTQVSTLSLRTDAILNSTIMSKFTTSEIDEVRISSYTGGDRGDFDAVSKDVDVINSLRLFLTLNNPGTNGLWNVIYSSLGKNYMTGSNWAGSSLAADIYRANGDVNGMQWTPSIPKEALIDPGSNQATIQDDLDLWVRASSGYCNGVVKTDQRGLSRSDFVNPNDPNQYGVITDCDVGAFEWNNGYQLDCWDEDGLRPENSLSGGVATVCFSDPNSLTPKALLNNFGSANISMLYGLILITLIRLRRRPINKI